MGDNDTGAGKKPRKPKPPKLPKTAPGDIKDFVSCKKATVELAPGKLEWLDLPITPEVKGITAGADGSVEVELDTKLKTVKVKASVKDGKLELDTSTLPFGADGANEWVDKLNDWIASKGKKLGPPTVKDGKLTLSKVAVAAGAPARGVQHAAKLDPFPNVPAWEKGAAVATVALASFVAVATVPDSETTIEERTVTVDVASADDRTEPSTTTTTAPPPTVVPDVAVYGDFCIAIIHGDGSSTIIPYFTVAPNLDGTWTVTMTGPTGEVSGTGVVTNGLGQIPVQIFRYGRYDNFIATGPGGVSPPLGEFAALFPFEVGPSEPGCDPNALAPVPAVDTDPTTGPPGPPPDVGDAGDASGDPPTQQETRTQPVEVTTDPAPWPLLLIPGTVSACTGGLMLDESRRRRRRRRRRRLRKRAGRASSGSAASEVME